MKIFIQFVLLMVIAVLAIGLAILLGDRGAWYFAWLLGTVVIVLAAAAAGVMLDAQDARTDTQPTPRQ
jgi:predicted outer membrane lipoprotein